MKFKIVKYANNFLQNSWIFIYFLLLHFNKAIINNKFNNNELFPFSVITFTFYMLYGFMTFNIVLIYSNNTGIILFVIL